MTLNESTQLERPQGRAFPRPTAAPVGRLSIAVVIATVGRPATVAKLAKRLTRQTRVADRVLVVAVAQSDITGLDQAQTGAEGYLAPRGLCCQRNHALAILDGGADLVVFFDDDFVPDDDYLANAERLFLSRPDIVGATGRVVADGANGAGIGFDEAEAIVASHAPAPADVDAVGHRRGLYGCNMVIRLDAIGDLRFDEALPLYAWQEDVDFSYRLGAHGRLVDCAALAGVHMGEKAGRTSGRRLGYSQIANPIYLLRKSSIPSDLAYRIMRNNLASNLRGCIFPDPNIDRVGRLIGNIRAMADLITGRIHPSRIFTLD